MNVTVRHIVISILFLCNILGSSHLAQASDYDSNGEISFYGTYESISEDEDETTASDVLPESKGNADKNAINGSSETKRMGAFPQTGETLSTGLIGIGLLTIVISILFFIKRKRKEEE